MSYHRDTIVIGASAGGVHALRELLARLPLDLPASVFVVQHQAATSGHLTSVLDAATPLPVLRVDGTQNVHEGRVYVAQPDRHMVLAEGQVLAAHGARENRARPSINTTFRSAAAARGSRVVGVLLTGMLDDGVAGLEAIQRCGGVAVVQDPLDASFPDLPSNAIRCLEVDHVLPLLAIAETLAALTGQTAPPVPIPSDIALEATLWDPKRSSAADLHSLGEQVSFACPECGGPLWKIGRGGTEVYRCHTGHALSTGTLLDSQAEEIEHSLWVAVRSLTERAATLTKLAAQADPKTAGRFREQAAETTTHAEQARQFLLSLRTTRSSEQSPIPSPVKPPPSPREPS